VIHDLLHSIWRPILEILILAAAIYYVFSLVKGTRGFSILIGFMVVLLTLAIVSSSLDLKVLRSLLGTFSAFSAVAVLIIFQPELHN
jgi:diadenylate cyclase